MVKTGLLISAMEVILPSEAFFCKLCFLFFSSNRSDGHLTLRSQGQSAMFRVARDDAEHQICEKLRGKVGEFLELENYDWLLVEPKGHASSFVTDLIAFLQSTFLSFTNLPVSQQITFSFLACA